MFDVEKNAIKRMLEQVRNGEISLEELSETVSGYGISPEKFRQIVSEIRAEEQAEKWQKEEKALKIQESESFQNQLNRIEGTLPQSLIQLKNNLYTEKKILELTTEAQKAFFDFMFSFGDIFKIHAKFMEKGYSYSQFHAFCYCVSNMEFIEKNGKITIKYARPTTETKLPFIEMLENIFPETSEPSIFKNFQKFCYFWFNAWRFKGKLTDLFEDKEADSNGS